MQANKPGFMALAQELNLSPVQLHTLRIIEPGVEVPISSLGGPTRGARPDRAPPRRLRPHQRALRDALRAAVAGATVPA